MLSTSIQLHTMHRSSLILFFALVLGTCEIHSFPWKTTEVQNQIDQGSLVYNHVPEDEDKEAFFQLLNNLLWDADPEESGTARGLFRQQGLLGRPMPQFIRRQDNAAGSLYRNFADQCYGILCTLGLKGLARSLLQLTL